MAQSNTRRAPSAPFVQYVMVLHVENVDAPSQIERLFAPGTSQAEAVKAYDAKVREYCATDRRFSQRIYSAQANPVVIMDARLISVDATADWKDETDRPTFRLSLLASIVE